MNKRRQKLLFFTTIIAFIFLMNTSKAQAWSAPEDMTEPFEYGPYTINMPLILAEDSILWELLENFNTLQDDDCRTKTEPFISTHRTTMENLFPWFDSDDDISDGAETFCSILSYIPDAMAQALTSAGFQNPAAGGLSTNIFDPTITPNWHAIDGLVLDHPLVRITFTERIDLLNHDFVGIVLGFAKAFDTKTGYIALDSDMVTGLKSTGAIITLKNIENFEDPIILVDGRIDEQLISALVYDQDAKTVTFNTQHFTSFEVVERSSVPVEDDEEDDDDKKRPKIYSAKIEHLTYADGRDYYKVTAHGKNFDKGFDMYLGGRRSIKEVRVNSKKAIGYFKTTDFINAFQDTYKLKIYNSSSRKRTFDEELPIKNIPHQFMN